MTKVSFVRSGGVMGGELRLELNLDDMSDDEAKHLQGLIEDANFFTIPTGPATSSHPDEFHYTITVDNGHEKHTVRTTESMAPRSLQPLIKELTMQKLLS